MAKSKREAEAEVRSWGFGKFIFFFYPETRLMYIDIIMVLGHVFTWSDGPYDSPEFQFREGRLA